MTNAAMLKIEPYSAYAGCEISGVRLAEPQPPEIYRAIGDALETYGVVFLRDQHLSSEQLIDFGAHFGRPQASRFNAHVEGFPVITELRKEPDQTRNVGGGWHTDRPYNPNPLRATLLTARELPPKGGDTLFANMCAAYDALSDGLKTTLATMRGVHSNAHVYGPNSERGKESGMNTEGAIGETAHPVARPIPGTGRKSLYVSPTYTVRFDGWTEAESRPLLAYLFAHGQRPEFATRFRWTVGAVALWDNRQMWHYAPNDYHGYRRVMHRIALLEPETSPS
jgi:taurine dioxygenase